MNGMPGKNGIPGRDGKVGMPGRDGEHRVIISVFFFFLTKSELKELGSLPRALQTRDGIIIISLRFVLLLQ